MSFSPPGCEFMAHRVDPGTPDFIFAILMPFESQPWLVICQRHLGGSCWCSHVSLVNSLGWASSTDPKLDEVVFLHSL